MTVLRNSVFITWVHFGCNMIEHMATKYKEKTNYYVMAQLTILVIKGSICVQIIHKSNKTKGEIYITVIV